MSTDLIHMWHAKARPAPTQRDFDVQLGCHLEEIAEMLETLEFYSVYNPHRIQGANTDLYVWLTRMATNLKEGGYGVDIVNRNEFLDAIADQVVTGIGAAHCAKMDAVEAIRRVNTSNWTKVDTVTGEFLRDANGKIIKPEGYEPPNLEGLY